MSETKRCDAYRLERLAAKKTREEILAEEEKERSAGEGLKRVLSLWDVVAYGVGTTIGAGVFVTTGVVAKSTAGPAIVFSFLAAGISSLFSALCYAEFAASIPVAGSAYTFAYASLGEFIAWFIGWNLNLEYAISASAVARGWAGYVGDFFSAVNVSLPYWVYNITIDKQSVVNGTSISDVVMTLSPLAIVVVLGCMCLLLFGVENSAKANLAFTIINLVLILFIVIYGATFVDVQNWSDFFPYGGGGVLSGAGTVFFSFIGFDTVTTLAEEMKNPRRDLPLGILLTLVIATVLYSGVSLVITGMVPYTSLSDDAPLSDAFVARGAQWAGILVAFGSVSTLTSTTLCSIVGQPRIFLRMSRDGLLFKPFGKVSKKKKVPVFGTLVTGIAASVLAFIFDISSLTDMISIGTLLAFCVVCGGIVINRHRCEGNPRPYLSPILLLLFFVGSVGTAVSLKYNAPIYVSGIISLVPLSLMIALSVVTFKLGKKQSIPDTFKCPLVPIVPCLGIFVNVYLTVSLSAGAWYRLLIWTALGSIIYFGYGIRNSRIYHLQRNQKHKEEAEEKAFNESLPEEHIVVDVGMKTPGVVRSEKSPLLHDMRQKSASGTDNEM